MKSFRDFTDKNNKSFGFTNEKDGKSKNVSAAILENAETNGQARDERVTAETLTKQIAAAYRGKNDKAVLADIVASAERGKKSGTLTNEEIDAFYRRFAPMLNFVQRKKLEQIVTQLKNI